VSEHVILVAVSVEAPTREAAHLALHRLLPEVGDSTPDAAIESWWPRTTGSTGPTVTLRCS
jgi:hypothetical protein